MPPSERYPKARAQKMGFQPDHRVRLVHFSDPELIAEIEGCGAVVLGTRSKAVADMLVMYFETLDELPSMHQAIRRMTPDGTCWAIWRKGRNSLREDDIRNEALRGTLVDVKVMAYSELLSGLKLVIRKEFRATHGT